MGRNLAIVAAVLAVLSLPFLFRREASKTANPDDVVVVITPHNESIRREFAQGFRSWYEEKTGRTIHVDWRVIGGTSEITRFIGSEYSNAFRNHWEKDLDEKWSAAVQGAFNNRKHKLPDDPADETVADEARRAFLASDVSCGLDVFFGGGAYDFITQSAAGHLVDCGVLDQHPEWFGDGPDQIPATFAGETFRDADGRWIGTVLSSFGILYNSEALQNLGIETAPRQWSDLTDPRLFGQVALADPSKSGSMNKAFEMIVQQQMQARLAALQAADAKAAENTDTETVDAKDADTETEAETVIADADAEVSETVADVKTAETETAEAEAESDHRETENAADDAEAAEREAAQEAVAVREGWMEAMQLIQRISANARYFTDSSTKPNIDVAAGDCAAGMTIDFYGRFQEESVSLRGSPRLRYITPEGGSTVSVDPIGILRGAPNREPAEAFIEYVLSLDGQKLWNFRAGVPGGPEIFALRRPPIRPELYAPEYDALRSDPTVAPYAESGGFTYRSAWTGRLFNPLRFIIRTAFMDCHKELKGAWQALIDNDFPPEATALFDDLSAIDHAAAAGPITAAASNGKGIEAIRAAKDLGGQFRERYRRVEILARAGK